MAILLDITVSIISSVIYDAGKEGIGKALDKPHEKQIRDRLDKKLNTIKSNDRSGVLESGCFSEYLEYQKPEEKIKQHIKSNDGKTDEQFKNQIASEYVAYARKNGYQCGPDGESSVREYFDAILRIIVDELNAERTLGEQSISHQMHEGFVSAHRDLEKQFSELKKASNEPNPDNYIISEGLPYAESKSKLAYLYNPDKLPLTGREREIAELREFCNDNSRFLWWAVLGPGGSGKSRLVYTFATMQRSEGWGIYYVKDNDYEHLSILLNLPKDSIIVADYISMHIDQVTDFIKKIKRQPGQNHKIRLLLIDRASEDLSAQKDNKKEYSLWSLMSGNRNDVRHTLYKGDAKKLLFLKDLNDKSLKNIIATYINVTSGLTPSDNTCKLLADRLDHIDPQFRRPLYARIIADAWIHNDGIIENWSDEDLLNGVVDREEDRWFRYAKTKEKKRQESKEGITWAVAMITSESGMPLEDFEEKYQQNFKKKFEKQLKNCSTKDFFKYNDLLEWRNNTGEYYINALEPDIVGEFFVLRWLTNNPEYCRQYIFEKGWKKSLGKLQFLQHLILDNRTKLNSDSLKYDSLWSLIWDCIFNSPVSDSLPFVIFLFELTTHDNLDIQLKRQSVKAIGEICSVSREEISVVIYASGLFNLSCDAELEESRKYIESLRGLAEAHPDNAEVIAQYAKGLFNRFHFL